MGTVGNLIVRYLGSELAYEPIWEKMQRFTQQRDTNTPDELWLLDHAPVFTLGRNGKREHILAANDIPVVQVDRGGQVTYHGPGQLIVYALLDARRKGVSVRELVTKLEQAVINLFAQYEIAAIGDREAPGVYVGHKKIAALGLRVSRGCTYHGLSLNVCMDTKPFQYINPCGYKGLQVTQCSELGMPSVPLELAGDLCTHLALELAYEQLEWAVDC